MNLSLLMKNLLRGWHKMKKIKAKRLLKLFNNRTEHRTRYSLVLAVVLNICLVACGNSGGTNENTQSATGNGSTGANTATCSIGTNKIGECKVN